MSGMTSAPGCPLAWLSTVERMVALPAACGELFQGTLDGIPCLVSCPIDQYAYARVEVSTLSPRDCGPSRQPWSVPKDAPKAAAALFKGLSQFGDEAPTGRLRLLSRIPRARGYASSTADVGAALFALAEALGYTLRPAEVARLAVSIEPSDSTLFSGLSLFAHRDGRLRQRLGPAPPLTVIALDPGGEVDTLAFNALDHRAALRRLAPDHREAFRLLLHGLRRRDWRALGGAATLSSRLHQAILRHPLLDMALHLARSVGALGVCRAHSGTVLGLLMDPQEADIEEITRTLSRALPDAVSVAPYALVGGGPRRVTFGRWLSTQELAGGMAKVVRRDEAWMWDNDACRLSRR